ncbi:MAG TPA: TetR family transcriptional regulator, partial [Porphyromonadaceae bacterium]|nr:TetR family transcriptional regulator [Porphyromonadaceae bacterium]
IAEASGYGRRTLYTYFKNKKDVYKAVIGSELQKLYAALEDVIKRDLPADDKLMMFTFSRLSIIKEVVTRNGTLRADFFRDIWLVENVRKEFDKKEIHYL